MKHRRTNRTVVMQKKTAERWPEQKIAEQRYKKFVEPILENLRIHARKLTSDPATADDMVEEAVIKIIANSGKYEPKKGSKKTYTLQIGIRRMIEFNRSEKIRKRSISLDKINEDFLSIRIKKKKPDQFDQITNASRKEIAARVKQLLDKTRISQNIKNTFAFYTGLEDGKIKTYRETAAHFKIPIGSVKSRIAVARKSLKKTIKKS